MKFVVRHIVYVIVVALVVTTLICCKYTAEQKQEPELVVDNNDYTQQAEVWVDSIITTMSLEEQVGQLFMPSSYAYSDESTFKQLRKYIADNHVGGVLFLKGDVCSQAFLSDTLQAISRVPLFIGMDAEWGLNMRLNDAPKFPVNYLLGKTNDDQLMYDYGREVGREARLLGINMIMGPVLDVLTNSNNKVIGKRAFSSDAKVVAEMAVAYARGLEDGNVLSIGKHFPGHGATSVDSHKELPLVSNDLAQLDTVDFLPFKEYVKNNLSGVMVGHLYMPAIDSLQRSAVVSPVIITDFLKDKLKFEGLILTDAINMGGVADVEHIAVSALLAGADIIVSPQNTSMEIAQVLRAVRTGVVSHVLIREKCRKILMYKYKLGLNELCGIDFNNAMEQVNNAESEKLFLRLDSAVNQVID